MSITTYISRGIGPGASIKDYILRGLGIGDDSVISDGDADKIATYVWAKVLGTAVAGDLQLLTQDIYDLLVTIRGSSTTDAAADAIGLAESLTRLKLIQNDIDELKKRTKYWEDRNLLRQTPDEKTGRADFRNRRQNPGGES